jgi:hypothetical protein
MGYRPARSSSGCLGIARWSLAGALALLAGCGAAGSRAVAVGGADLGAPRDLAPVFGSDDLIADTDLPPPLTDDADFTFGDDAGVNPCVARAELIYTIDQDNVLASFAPKTLKFTDIVKLKCPARNFATPFSMGVDVRAVAWVLYTSGEVFQVDTQNGKCGPSLYAPNQNGFTQFGMGFVSDQAGGFKEHLYISGVGNHQLGSIDPVALRPVAIGPLNGTPELTGNGKAELWGFFPDNQMPRVAQLDKGTAAEGKTYTLKELSGSPNAWAFAYWGGDFWIFLKKNLDPSTHVYHLVAATGKVTDVVPNSGRTIVGAGVSICAPTSPTH